MTKKSPHEKRAIKRQSWIERTMIALDCDETTARKLLAIKRNQSVRINTLKADTDSIARRFNLNARFEWCTDGFHLTPEQQTAILVSDENSRGDLYVQNAASWLPCLALDPQPSDTILDICAAPGGKTSHLAALTNGQAAITANDNSRPRLEKLRLNMSRLGATAEYTLFDATQLARKLDGQLFDKILLDAPCSGEGMMSLDNDSAFDSWSVAQIKRLSSLQKRLVSQAWQLLADGGTLVYSTCTMAPEENEAVVDYLLRKNSDASLQAIEIPLPNRVPYVKTWNDKLFQSDMSDVIRLKPSADIEAFFVAKIQKVSKSDIL